MPFKNVLTISCSKKRFKVQNDLRDWEIDIKNKPLKLIDEKYWIMKGVPVDPRYIPDQEIVLEKISIVDGKEIVETLSIEKAIKDATIAKAISIGDVIDVVIDPIVEVKP